MEKLIVQGGKPLQGIVRTSGAKNAVLPIIAASILGRTPSRLSDVPVLEDVRTICAVLSAFGAKFEIEGNVLRLDTREISGCEAPYELVRQMRATFVVMGPLLARVGRARISLPGGCAIGARPIDIHLKGFEALGVQIEQGYGYIDAKVPPGGMQGATVYFDFPSVGATENVLMAAVVAKGTTIIENAAQEPEIVALANYLNLMGARVRGAGTDTLRVQGVSELHGATYSIIPDRIEAGTYMIAAAMTGGDVIIDNVLPEHQTALLAKLREAGAHLEIGIDKIRVSAPEPLKAISVKTLPYPGFPTDMQPQLMALMTIASGRSRVTETVFENRFMHVTELNRMGASISAEGRNAVIEGPRRLTGCDVHATDLRAGAAMILAGLVADGTTRIGELHHIDRGYENIVAKLQSLGAAIKRVDIQEKYHIDENRCEKECCFDRRKGEELI